MELASGELPGTSCANITVKAQTEIRPELAKAILAKGYDLYQLQIVKNSLEDVFHTLTQEVSND